ncbi:hypothetical protein ISCGN_026933 [Ixodes scapularis]
MSAPPALLTAWTPSGGNAGNGRNGGVMAETACGCRTRAGDLVGSRGVGTGLRIRKSLRGAELAVTSTRTRMRDLPAPHPGHGPTVAPLGASTSRGARSPAGARLRLSWS